MFGTNSFEVMPFGLMNALATYQKAIKKIEKNLDGFPFVRVYLDNIVIFLKTINDHLENIPEVKIGSPNKASS